MDKELTEGRRYWVWTVGKRSAGKSIPATNEVEAIKTWVRENNVRTARLKVIRASGPESSSSMPEELVDLAKTYIVRQEMRSITTLIPIDREGVSIDLPEDK